MSTFRAALFLALAVPASADVLLTRNVHTDEVQTPQGAKPAKDEAQTIWLTKDKVRIEAGQLVCIVRLDQKKLHVLHPADGSYSTVDLPVNLASHVAPDQQADYEKILHRLSITTLVTPTDEVERVKGWAAKKYKVQLSSQGMTSEESLWTTKDVEVDWSTYWEAQTAVRCLQPGGEAYATEMRKIEGIVVKADKVRTSGDVKVHTVEELVSAERKEAPEGLYEPPKEFTQKPFDTIAEVRRMMGPRSNAGPGDAPPPKGDDEKKDGPRRRKEKEGTGGDEKKGG